MRAGAWKHFFSSELFTFLSEISGGGGVTSVEPNADILHLSVNSDVATVSTVNTAEHGA